MVGAIRLNITKVKITTFFQQIKTSEHHYLLLSRQFNDWTQTSFCNITLRHRIAYFLNCLGKGCGLRLTFDYENLVKETGSNLNLLLKFANLFLIVHNPLKIYHKLILYIYWQKLYFALLLQNRNIRKGNFR